MATPKRPPYRPGWTTPGRGAAADDLPRLERGDPQLQRALAADRAAELERRSQACAACAELRRASADDQALCDEHLGWALGVTGGWALGGPGRKI